MHLGKFHAAVFDLITEYNSKDIPGLLHNVVSHLDSISGNPGNVDVAQAFKAQVEALRSALSSSAMNHPRPTLAAMLDEIGARKYIGDNLFNLVERTISENNLTPQLAAAKLRELIGQTTAFFGQIAAMDAAFNALDVEYVDIDPGEGEIGISIPQPDGARLLSDLAATAKKWNQVLSPFVELADPDHNPIAVRTISSTDWQLYLTAGTGVLLVLSGAIRQINEILGKLVETKELVGKLRDNGMSEQVIDAAAADADLMLNRGAADLAQQIVSANPPEDASRGHELTISITRSLKYIAKEMSENVTIEVRYLPPETPKDLPEDETARAELTTSIESLTTTAAQIARNMDFVSLDRNVSKILNLPAPDGDREADVQA